MDKDLVFLISLPRSGSTLLQQMIAQNEEVMTLPESWLMLHPLYGVKENGIQTEYSHKIYHRHINNFLKKFDDEEIYYKSIKKMSDHLYNTLLRKHDRRIFLDKVPRYYLILDELQKVYPEAKYILLIRHPLAIFSSMLRFLDIQYWSQGEDYFKLDMIKGLNNVLKAKDKYSNILFVSYEELLENPNKVLKNICQYIDIDFTEDMINYGGTQLEKNNWGDPKNIYRNDKPNKSFKNKWIKHFQNPVLNKMARQYLEYIGEVNFEKLGYSYQDTLKNLSLPSYKIYLPSPSFDYIVGNKDNLIWDTIIKVKYYISRITKYVNKNN